MQGMTDLACINSSRGQAQFHECWCGMQTQIICTEHPAAVEASGVNVAIATLHLQSSMKETLIVLQWPVTLAGRALRSFDGVLQVHAKVFETEGCPKSLSAPRPRAGGQKQKKARHSRMSYGWPHVPPTEACMFRTTFRQNTVFFSQLRSVSHAPLERRSQHQALFDNKPHSSSRHAA